MPSDFCRTCLKSICSSDSTTAAAAAAVAVAAVAAGGAAAAAAIEPAPASCKVEGLVAAQTGRSHLG